MRPRHAACLTYLGLVSVLGAAAVALAIYRIVIDGVGYQWLILAYLTILTGAFTIRVPGVNSKISVADTFIFINTILFGTAAGTLTAAIDGALASVRFETPSRRRRATPFNAAAMGLSAFAAGEFFFKLFGKNPLSLTPSLGILDLALPVAMYALIYYLCNSVLVAVMVALDGGDNALRILREDFLKTLVLSPASVAAGALIAFYMRTITPRMLIIVVPILVTIYFVDKICLGSGANPTIEADNNPVHQRPAYRRFHYFMVALGLGFICLLALDMLKDKISHQWLVIALLAACASFISVKIPGIRIKITLADTFVFANIILFGPVAGGITAALDGLAGSLRCKTKARRMDFTLFNMAAMALSAYVAGEIFFLILGRAQSYQADKVVVGAMFLPALVLAVSYYLMNALGVAFIVALQGGENVLQVWRENLLWSLATYISCAFGAVFLAAGTLAITPSITVAVMLLLAIIYISYRSFAWRASSGIQTSA